MKIVVGRDELNQDFIQTRIEQDSKFYQKSRGGFKPADLIAALASEVAVSKHLGENCSVPDTEMYSSGKKNYNADLECDGVKYHVKSQTKTSKENYGAAWVFQKTDGLFKGKKQDEYLALTSVDVASNINLMNMPDEFEVTIEKIVKVGDLQELFGDEERMLMDVVWHQKFKNAVRLIEVNKDLGHNDSI